MSLEQELIQKCPIYMAPFVSTIDLLKHAYAAYNIDLSKTEFSNRLNTLCFSDDPRKRVMFAIPNDDSIYFLTVNKFIIRQYEEIQHDPNPLRINSSGISGGFEISGVEKAHKDALSNFKQSFSYLFDYFKENTINTGIDDIRNINDLTTEEFCRAVNAMTTMRLHIPILRMCMQYVSPIHYDASDRLIFLDIDTLRSFQFYPALLTGILLASETQVFCNPLSLLTDTYQLFIRAMMDIRSRALSTQEEQMVHAHQSSVCDVDIERLRVVDLDTLDIAIVELAFYKP